MATNPQSILNQTVPVTGQPTATQVPANQLVQQTPVSQQTPVAGAAPAPSVGPFQQQARLLSTAAPGQPTQPGLLNTAQSQPYYSLIPFMAAMESQPQIALPSYGDPALAGIQQRLIAQQQSNPLLSGQKPVAPQSVLAKTQAPMSVGDLLGTAGQQLWQQEVVNPVQDYINTWKRDPKMGLLETLGGVAVMGGLVGVEALTGGAATPFIFGALAVMQAPNLIGSWGQEITNPSDQHLVQALVSSGSAAIAVGSPVKAFKGIKTARNLFEMQVQLRKDATTTDRIATLLTGFRESGKGVSGIKTGAPLAQQLETLDVNDADGLEAQLAARGADLKNVDDPAAQLVAHAKTLEKLQGDVVAAHAQGDKEAVANALGEIKKLGPDLRAAMLTTAYHYTYLPSTPYSHVPLGAIQGVGAEVHDVVNKNYNAIYGLLRQMHSGIGLQGPSDMAAADIASIKEAEGLDRAAGTPADTGNRMETYWNEIRKELGMAGDAHEEKVLQALEEPDKWKDLAPNEQLYGQKLRDFFDVMTSGELKYGYISHALQGRVPYAFTGPKLSEVAKEQAKIEAAAGRTYELEPRPYGSKSRQWKMAVDELTGRVDFTTKTRSQIVEAASRKKDLYEATHEHRQVFNTHEKQIRTWRRAYGQLSSPKGGDPIKADALVEGIRLRLGDAAADLVTMGKKLDKVLAAAPAEKELVTGGEAIRRAFRSHVNRMQRAAFGEALQAHADLSVKKLEDVFKKMPQAHWNAAMVSPKFTSKHELPDVLPETVWAASGDIEGAAKKMGYFPIHPATGSPRDLNYRPALYGRGELANNITKAVNQTTAAQAQNDFLNALYKIGAVSKRYIMYNPVYHALNVAGRAIAFVTSDPTVAGSAFKAVKALRQDPAAYNSLLEEAGMAGMVHATQFNVSDKLRRLLAEEDGQSGFPGAIRNAVATLDNVHKDTAERGLWAAVDHLQLAGYVYSKQRFLDRGINEFQARRLAGQYANNLGGMVNPLYMSRLWRQLKGMVFFAPSYWSTFLHSLQSVMPGAARISEVTNRVAGGRFAGLAAVPLRAIDYRSRVELVRAQRDWMVTYLATTAVSMDMMNVMFSGHHLWDNEQGHEWDIDVTNMPLLGGTQTSSSGEVRRAYITAMPLFRQGVDIGNAIGLGHDWGFGHVFGDATWQQQDILHKSQMAMGALLDGTRRAASTKIGQVPQAAYQLATGEDLSARLGEGTQVKIDRPLALASLAPQGYQFQRLWKNYQQSTLMQYAPGTPQFKQAEQQFQQQAQQFLPQMLINQSGLPSVYHMGVERPSIDDSKYENWVIQRTGSQSRMTQYSNSVFNGQMTPLEYARHKHEEQIRINQLNIDTWGQNSPGATLNSAYSSLATQFGLDDAGLSDQDWFERYDAFLPAWNQILQSAAPSTRAAWWEHSTAQWTDADYLEWEARELRDSLAASIDGQGGNYIRSFQNQLFRLKPSLTVAEYTAMENSDPYYSSYRAMLSAMGQTSPLGAFVSAFSSPYTKTYIPPAGTTPAEAQALAAHTGQVVVRPEEAQKLAQQAKQVAQEPSVAQAGGIAAASPDFQQQEQAAVQAAQSGVPEAP